MVGLIILIMKLGILMMIILIIIIIIVTMFHITMKNQKDHNLLYILEAMSIGITTQVIT